jgi:hypothetical protein
VQDQGQRRPDEGQAQGEQVDAQAEGEAQPGRPDDLGRREPVKQPVVVGDPDEQPAERHPQEHEHGAVDRDRGLGLLAALAQEVGHYRGRERDQRRPQQQVQVQHQ